MSTPDSPGIAEVAEGPSVSGSRGITGGGLVASVVALGLAVGLLALGRQFVADHPGLFWFVPPAVTFLFLRRQGLRRDSLVPGGVALIIAGVELAGVLPEGPVEWGVLGTLSVLLTGAALYRLSGSPAVRPGGAALAPAGPSDGDGAADLESAPPLEIRDGEIRESDPLTRLLRRPLLELFLERHVAAARRGYDLSVVLFHLEGFRDFADAHGQAGAQQLLGKVGDVLTTSARDMDVTGRYGQHEFLALLLGEKPEGAKVFADRIREEVDGLTVELADGTTTESGVTASAGVAVFREAMDSASELVETADMALRQALNQGGRRTIIADTESRSAP